MKEKYKEKLFAGLLGRNGGDESNRRVSVVPIGRKGSCPLCASRHRLLGSVSESHTSRYTFTARNHCCFILSHFGVVRLKKRIKPHACCPVSFLRAISFLTRVHDFSSIWPTPVAVFLCGDNFNFTFLSYSCWFHSIFKDIVSSSLHLITV